MGKFFDIDNKTLVLIIGFMAALFVGDCYNWKKNEKPAITEQTKESQLESAIKSYEDFKDKLPNEQGSTMEGMFKNEEKLLTDILNKAKDVPDYNWVLNAYSGFAGIYFHYGDEKFSREQGKQTDFYKKSIEMCDEALKLIKEKNEGIYRKDDFLYMRGRANASLGRIEEAVQNYISALLSLSSKKDKENDREIKFLVNKDLHHLLSGESNGVAEMALRSTYRLCGEGGRRKILNQLHQTGPYDDAYRVITGKNNLN